MTTGNTKPSAAPASSGAGQIGMLAAVSIGIGGMVGAGIFSILGVVAQAAGNAMWLAFVIGGVVALLSTYSYAKLGATNAQFLVTFIFVAIIMAIGGVLGVMNTMFAAISQRAKDIGVMRLLGYSRLQILMSFLMESVLISLAGGLLGLAIGYLADGYTASSIISGGQGQGGKSVVLRMTVDLSVLLSAAVLTFLMGAVGGFLPSVSAMRLKPLESLR